MVIVSDVILPSRIEAENLLDELEKLWTRYGTFTVSDIYELVGMSTSYTHTQYGWDNIGNFGVKREQNGYAVTFPAPSPMSKFQGRDIYKGFNETPTMEGFFMDDLEEKFDKKLEEIKKDPKIITKGAIKMVVGYCTGAIATVAIHTLVPKDTLSRKQKIQLSVAAWALGGAVADRAGEWAANDSFTGTLLCAITDQFKKTDEPKPEPTIEDTPEETSTK